MASEKKLYKKTSEKKICGVCAGLAEYLNMDVMPDEDDLQPPYDNSEEQ